MSTITTPNQKRTVQVTLSRQYYKEVTIDIEVDESNLNEDYDLQDYLTDSQEVQESLEKAISEANLMPGYEKYQYFDEVNKIGGTL